jgi:2-iminobutanoate/2-iminopropanoate deaminase
MTRTSVFVNPAGLRPVAAYNHAVLRPGRLVHLTGQVAWNVAGDIVGRGDIAAQVAQTWANIHLVLDALRATSDDIVKLTTYATDRAHMPAIAAERDRHFTAGHFPASTFLVVSGLADPDLLVEIEAVVAVPDSDE